MGPWFAQPGASGWLAMAVVWIGVVALVVWAVGRLFPGRSDVDAGPILDARLAAREIDAETHRAIRGQTDGDPSVQTKGHL